MKLIFNPKLLILETTDEKFSGGEEFDSCLDAFKHGLILPNPGESISINIDGTLTECFAEDPYDETLKCPKGWIGKKSEEKCLKIHTKPEDNTNAARQCYREGSDLFQDEHKDWNEIFIDATHFSSNYSTDPVYPGYYHLGLYQKQSGNHYLYHRNGARVSHTYTYPNSLLQKERGRSCIGKFIKN